MVLSDWWFGTMMNHGILWLSIYWECHNPNWRTPSFFRGVGQPPARSYDGRWVRIWGIQRCFSMDPCFVHGWFGCAATSHPRDHLPPGQHDASDFLLAGLHQRGAQGVDPRRGSSFSKRYPGGIDSFCWSGPWTLAQSYRYLSPPSLSLYTYVSTRYT